MSTVGIVGVFLILAVGFGFAGYAIQSLKRGHITVGGRGVKSATFSREKNPLDFWGFVIWFGGSGLLAIGFVLYWCLDWLRQ